MTAVYAIFLLQLKCCVDRITKYVYGISQKVCLICMAKPEQYHLIY